VVKKGQFWVAISVVKKRQYSLVISVATKAPVAVLGG